MGGVRAPTTAAAAAAAFVSRLECLKLEWTLGNLGTRTLCCSSSPSLIFCHSARDCRSAPPAAPAARLSHLDRVFFSHEPVLIQRRAQLNGSRRAHLSAVHDDRARAGVRLDAVPHAERQTPQTGCWTPASLKFPYVPRRLEGE